MKLALLALLAAGASACFVPLSMPSGSGDAADGREAAPDGDAVSPDPPRDESRDPGADLDHAGDDAPPVEDGPSADDAAAAEEPAEVAGEDAGDAAEEEEPGEPPCLSRPGICPAGEFCRPLCFDSVTGCGAPPGALLLGCRSPVVLPDDSACTFTTGSLDEQEPCLRCEAKRGMTVLARTDFGDDGVGCHLDGWELVTGTECPASYDAACAAVSAVGACCGDLGSICLFHRGSYVLRAQRNAMCTGGKKEWRVRRTVDTRGLDRVEVCLGLGKGGDLNDDDRLVVEASDAGSFAVAACWKGSFIESDVAHGVDGPLHYRCVPLPAWAGGNPAVTVTVAARSGATNHALYVDDVSVRGWSAGCTPGSSIVFAEGFTACPYPIPDGWHGWRFTGAGRPRCPGYACAGSGDTFRAEAGPGAGAWSMERAADLGGIDGPVQLCFDLSEDGAGSGESIAVEYSTDAGASWKNAWRQEGDMTPDRECARICVELSPADPAVARNRDLRVRFSLASDGAPVNVDNVSLTGAAWCDGGTALTLTAVAGTGTAGEYGVTAHDAAGAQMTAAVSCSWGDVTPPVEDHALVWFRQ